jgi:23S rRNA (cytosine1962-C5)-methyltransferase
MARGQRAGDAPADGAGQERFDAIVLDPPAFAKSRTSVPDALRGYQRNQLRALRLLAPGGFLLTASCSFHVRLPQFLGMLSEAAGDSGRAVGWSRFSGKGRIHPEVLTTPRPAIEGSGVASRLRLRDARL